MANWSFVKYGDMDMYNKRNPETATWFAKSPYWNNGWVGTATNTSGDSLYFRGVIFRFTSGNTGGRWIYSKGERYIQANGSGCDMYVVATYGGKSATSYKRTIPPTYYDNCKGDLSSNTSCYFSPRNEEATSYEFTFPEPIEVPNGGEVLLKFYGENWVGSSSPGSGIIQISNRAFLDEPTTVYYDVTFNLAGGTRTGGGALNQTIEEGLDANPPTCTRTGYRFVGWSGSYTNITSNRTITAMWEALPIWRFNGTSWEKVRIARRFNGSTWLETPVYKQSNGWKKEGS